MPRPSRDVARLAERFELGLVDVPPRGPAGERLGRGTGASLEFQDRRAYSVGDDVRHLDWRAFARTDQLLVRLWREEVLPRVEVLVDVSRSMSVDETKAQRCVDLAALFALAARESGALAVVIALDATPRVVELERLLAEGLELDGGAPMTEVLPLASALLRAGSVRIAISDCLFPHDAAELVRPLAARAGALALVQVLSAQEERPAAGAAQRLTDSETGEQLDVVLDLRTVERYRERLRRLSDALEVECRRARGRFVPVSSAQPLEVQCCERLAREGLLVPR